MLHCCEHTLKGDFGENLEEESYRENIDTLSRDPRWHEQKLGGNTDGNIHYVVLDGKEEYAIEKMIHRRMWHNLGLTAFMF